MKVVAQCPPVGKNSLPVPTSYYIHVDGGSLLSKTGAKNASLFACGYPVKSKQPVERPSKVAVFILVVKDC